jgi:uncharacterized protein
MKMILHILLLLPFFSAAQLTAYEDSLNGFIKKYVDSHEVVKGSDKQQMQFYPVKRSYRVAATFERKENSQWFAMSTSGTIKKQFRVFGILSFVLNDTACTLSVYQSKQLIASPEFADYLFIPFTDRTCGLDTYGGGRYIDLLMNDIRGNTCILDFNKAYNPYCAYTTGYNCPVPPKENDLPIAVEAGEKNYRGH